MKFILITLFTFFTPALALSREVNLAVGETYEIITNESGKVFNTNSKVVKVLESKRGLLLYAKKEGVSEITLRSTTYSICVLLKNKLNAYLAFKKKVEKIPGLKLNIVDGEITIRGELVRFSDWQTLALISSNYDTPYLMKATLPEEIISLFRAHLKKNFESELLALPSIKFIPETKAFLSNSKKLSAYKKILDPWGISAEIGSDTVEIEPLIGVRILVTELRKNSFQRLGIKWPASYQAQLLSKASQSNSLDLSIEAIEQNGFGRILASPHLLCRSGKEASFLAGGEIPIRVSSYKSSQVIWKKYGILLGIKPKADFSGKMSIEISSEVSNIDPSTTIDGVPGFLTNQMQTHFDLEKSMTILLSGLLKKDSSAADEGLPFLVRLPVLGKLFSSQDYRNNQTELVIMVTPKVINQDEIESYSSNIPAVKTNDY